jgi:ankyrin repeat protein
MHSESRTYPKILFLLLLAALSAVPEKLFSQEEGDTVRFYSMLSMPDAQLNFNYSLLTAAADGDTIVLSWLLRNGAEIETRTSENLSPLFFAVANNRFTAARILLENGADPNVANNLTETPLLLAVKNENVEMAEMLIRDSANVDYTDRFGATALHYAALNGSFYMADLLLYYDAPVSKKTNDGTTPLIAAVCGGNADLADLLIQNGAKTVESDNMGFTPFLVAVQNKDTVMMSLLISKGADIHAINRFKFDAIDLAVKANSAETVKFLLKKDDKWTYSGTKSSSPYTVAVNYRRKNLIPVLKEAGIAGSYSGGFSQVTLSASVLCCFHDYYTGFSVQFIEPSLSLGITAGFDFKPGYTRLVKKMGDQIFYQYYDRGAVAWAGLIKEFPITDNIAGGNWFIDASVCGGFAFGNKLKGTEINPGNIFRFMPSAGVKWIKGNTSVNMTLEYFKTDFYKVGPVWFRIGAGWSIFRNNTRCPAKIIKWY